MLVNVPVPMFSFAVACFALSVTAVERLKWDESSEITAHNSHFQGKNTTLKHLSDKCTPLNTATDISTTGNNTKDQKCGISVVLPFGDAQLVSVALCMR